MAWTQSALLINNSLTLPHNQIFRTERAEVGAEVPVVHKRGRICRFLIYNYPQQADCIRGRRFQHPAGRSGMKKATDHSLSKPVPRAHRRRGKRITGRIITLPRGDSQHASTTFSSPPSLSNDEPPPPYHS
ncbi:hypothetical protein N7471_006483 [Penicillium samsonianum]|uniref:uncharacterized protein n=1 Tax=Penicillium samsonianum TaxID=1882272 RepID=UPI0025497C0D|nr:uncharacterized protein N7471_006483 [Penicillium samsonianum]KAJ6139997.1 hypothetical protein N7471_006483 [Penicillium samsonianum]